MLTSKTNGSAISTFRWRLADSKYKQTLYVNIIVLYSDHSQTKVQEHFFLSADSAVIIDYSASYVKRLLPYKCAIISLAFGSFSKLDRRLDSKMNGNSDESHDDCILKETYEL